MTGAGLFMSSKNYFKIVLFVMRTKVMRGIDQSTEYGIVSFISFQDFTKMGELTGDDRGWLGHPCSPPAPPAIWSRRGLDRVQLKSYNTQMV